MLRHAALALALALLAGCATQLPVGEVDEGRITPFSSAQPGGAVPHPWRALTLSRFKRATQYVLVEGPNGAVVEARAEGSASGLMHPLRVDLAATPWLSWRWRVDQLIAAADNAQAHLEDSPARIIVAFAGDMRSLPLEDQMLADQVRILTGQEMPYATLMYIWENRAPVGSIIANAHSSRVKMVVAASGTTGLGAWQRIAANVREDYRRAFGAEAPPVKYIGVMTDTDNTGTSARAMYGDLAFLAGP